MLKYRVNLNILNHLINKIHSKIIMSLNKYFFKKYKFQKQLNYIVKTVINGDLA